MFITFEGPDGSGKTTALQKLVRVLRKQGLDFVLTKEPGGTTSDVNKKIRKLIVDKSSKLTPMTEAILFSADRRMHLDTLINPALRANRIVLCDRYFDSTFAYQGSGRRLGIDKMIKLQETITDGLYPHATFYFNIDVKEAIKRVNKRGQKNRLDNESVEFIKRVHNGYKEVIKRNPRRFIIINANKNADEVANQVLEAFSKKVIKIKFKN